MFCLPSVGIFAMMSVIRLRQADELSRVGRPARTEPGDVGVASVAALHVWTGGVDAGCDVRVHTTLDDVTRYVAMAQWYIM